MRIVGFTAEQRDRIEAAIRRARSTPSERDQRLSAVEKAIQLPGDGLPEEAVDDLIDMVLDRQPPPPASEALIAQLFGRLPETIFQELGQLAALRMLSERLVETLLSTLGYEGDLDRSPDDLLDLCAEHASTLSPDLHQAVIENLAGCRDIERWQVDYEFQTIHRYRKGKFDVDGFDLDEFDMDDVVGNSAQTVMDLRNLIDRCERRLPSTTIE